MGLSVSDAIRLMLMRIAADKALPFDLKVPNAETLAAMAAARWGDDREPVTLQQLAQEWNEV